MALDGDTLPDGVAVQSKCFERPQLRVQTEHGEVTHAGSEYWLLNALGSKTVPDGKYLYNPQTKQIEVQWVQGIGSEKAPAPQARLMATVISGILNQRLPWRLVLLGVFMVVAVELLGIRSLSFAVGFYISIATTCAMFVGGLVRWLVDHRTKKFGGPPIETDVSPGSLFASGLIAAGGIVGLLGIGFNLIETQMRDGGNTAGADAFRHYLSFGSWVEQATGAIHYRIADAIGGANADAFGNILAILMFAVLAWVLYHFARKPLADGEAAK